LARCGPYGESRSHLLRKARLYNMLTVLVVAALLLACDMPISGD
jgi:hypothetical protein